MPYEGFSKVVFFKIVGTILTELSKILEIRKLFRIQKTSHYD